MEVHQPSTVSARSAGRKGRGQTRSLRGLRQRVKSLWGDGALSNSAGQPYTWGESSTADNSDLKSVKSGGSIVRILAIETTEAIGSLAAFDADALVCQRGLDPQLRSARSLAPGIQQLLADAGWRPSDVQLVAVTVGPGSFTGLRVGVTTAKTFAYAVGAEVLGIDTFLAIAERTPAEVAELAAALDAQRQQVFAARLVRNAAGHFHRPSDVRIVDNDAWLAELTPEVMVTGPALLKLAARVPSRVNVLEPSLWTPTAAAVGRVAWRNYQAGQRDDLLQLVPAYYRRSAAEEKRAAE